MIEEIDAIVPDLVVMEIIIASADGNACSTRGVLRDAKRDFHRTHIALEPERVARVRAWERRKRGRAGRREGGREN